MVQLDPFMKILHNYMIKTFEYPSLNTPENPFQLLPLPHLKATPTQR
jgi:hypothetical protein